MAALGKGNGRAAGVRWRRRALAIATAVVATGLISSMRPADASQDPFFPAQWNLQQINAPLAWQRSTGAGIRIGIVDSGVFGGQEDLVGKVVAATDCINTGGDPKACHGTGQDDTGHGTHMAGIAAAAKDNGRGIAGVAPDAHLVVARALTDNGGSIVDIEAGIRWAIQHGAQVINLSVADNPLAQHPLDLSFAAAVEEAWAAGVVPVVAAGNITSLGPGREDFAGLDALVVGATDTRGVLAPYSNPLVTTKWGVVAPGGSATGDRRDIISTWRSASAPNATNLYEYQGGASAAAAHVSGVVALLLAEGLTPAQAVQRILDTARPTSCGPGCHGLVDAAAAAGATSAPVEVKSAGSPTSAAPPPPPTTPTPSSTSPSTAPTTTSSPGAGASEAALAVPMPVERPPVAGKAAGASLFDGAWRPGWAVVSVLAGVALFLLLRRRYADDDALE